VLVVQRMLAQPSNVSRAFAVTLQYALWDFFREMGETDVGGHERLKATSSSSPGSVSAQKLSHLAKAYAWWVAKGGLSLTILKPLPFATLLPESTAFLSLLLGNVIFALHCNSPLLNSRSKLHADRVEEVFIKAATHSQLSKGLGYFIESEMLDTKDDMDAALEALRLGMSAARDVDAFL
jgi:nucleolar MIF4G domain-containing protein 1